MHIPVLLQEVIQYLDVKPGGKYIDATLGMGGHSLEIVKLDGVVLGLDQDPSAIEYLRKNFQFPIFKFQTNSKFEIPNSKFITGDFVNLKEIALREGFENIDGILFDLGFGSHQLDDPKRGFSFQKEGPLDMRYNPSEEGKSQIPNPKSQTAADVVNRYLEKDLIRIFREYGEEKRYAKSIAKKIIEQRKRKPIKTTTELFALIKHPDTARRIFQSLRIEVNRELENLKKALPQALDLLKPDGRLVVISFQSLEDRQVKRFFIDNSKDCVCSPQAPICTCGGNNARLRILTRKPITASKEEAAQNPRSKSAKLRAAEKI